MKSITFSVTNNPWINNGLVRLVYEFEKHFSNEILIKKEDNCVEFISNACEDIEFYINQVIYLLASDGTYNYGQVFKLINKYLDGSYSPPFEYPKEKGDAKKKENIPKEYIKSLKEYYKGNFSSKEQIWKMRNSYLGSEDNYIKYGLDFKSSEFFNKLISNESKNNLCPTCGNLSKNMVDVKQFFNPLLNEHHNNEIEGFGAFRKKVKFCPKCATLAIISLFDKFIPFYWNNKDTILALPNVYDEFILEKISNNLSLDSQFYNFSNPNITNYKSNILDLKNSTSKSGALLVLLHNIQNNFSKKEVDDLFNYLEEQELMALNDWIFITKDSYKIHRIKADKNIYKILKVQKNPDNNSDVYLVNDFFNLINFKGFSPYQIDKFFNSFLTLNHESIAQSLFEMVKSEISFYKKDLGQYTIYLFKNVFLNIIMEEILMLNDDFKKATKSIAETIGKSFFKDVGLMSKFAYATNESIFKEYVEEAFFLMAKKSALNSEETPYANINELPIFFDGLNKDNFRETKSYFVSFMSSSALFTNYKVKNQKNGEN